MQRDRFGSAALAAGLALMLGVSSADAATITQTVNLPAQTLLGPAMATANNTTPLTSTFAKFNPALGTLTGVSFVYDYRLSFTVQFGPSGGNASAVAGGPFFVNGVDSGTGSGNGGNNGGSPNTFATTPYPVAGTYAVPGSDFSAFVAASGSNTFTYQLGNNLNLGGLTDATGRIDLGAASSVQIVYTYVPEPATLGMMAMASMMVAARRRRDATPR